MTDEQIEQWKTERDIARAITDPESRKVALEKVYDHRDEMQMRCICHQARRQKEMAQAFAAAREDIDALKRDLVPLKAFRERAGRFTERVRGGITLWRILAALGAAGFGAVIVKLFHATNHLTN